VNKVPIIMVPRQGEGESKAALVLAHRAAARLGARIVISHVSTSLSPPDQLKLALGLSDEDLKGCVLECLEGDDVASRLIKRAEELQPRAIVLRTGNEREEVNAITSAIITGSCWAVLVLRRDLELPVLAEGHWVRRVLVPLDAAPTSAEAVRRAARIAHRENAVLELLHIAGPGVEGPQEPGSLPIGPFVDRPYDLRIWSTEFLNRFFHGVVPDTCGLTPALHLAVGEVADEIIRFAKDNSTDLIVMAWQGSLDEGRAGVVRQLLARSPCQLLFLVIDKAANQPGQTQSSASAA
jgi:nucleotide-binding universal stress UspA family protein